MGALLSRLFGGRNREEGQSRVNEQDRAVLVSARAHTQMGGCGLLDLCVATL